VAVVGGKIVVSPDSNPDFVGSVLQDQFGTLVDIDGIATGVPATAANLIAPAELFVFNVQPGGAVQPSPAQVVNVDPNFIGGLRISTGMLGSQSGLFAAAGTAGGSELRFFPFNQGIGPATLDIPVFGPNFPLSIYVGG
jgi:hypothetical protein